MAQGPKNIIFAYGVNGKTVTFRIQRDKDNKWLDADTGLFETDPANKDLPATEVAGVYKADESRVDWEEPNAQYTVEAYDTDVLAGSGKLSLKYGKGSVHIKPIEGSGGAAPLPADAATETSVSKLTPSTNLAEFTDVTDPITTGSGPYTAELTFGFTSKAVIIINNEATANLKISADGGSTFITLKAGADIKLGIEDTSLDLESAISGALYQVVAV